MSEVIKEPIYAFPIPIAGNATDICDTLQHGGLDYGGMTLRDYFAAKALEGDWASQREKRGDFADDTAQDSLSERAKLFYRMADAMLEARDL